MSTVFVGVYQRVLNARRAARARTSRGRSDFRASRRVHWSTNTRRMHTGYYRESARGGETCVLHCNECVTARRLVREAGNSVH